MSDKIKDAFERVKTDINSINKKIDSSDKKKIVIESELAIIKQKMIIEGELRDELGNMLKQMKLSMNAIGQLKEEFEDRIKGVETLVKSTKDSFKNDTNKIDQHFEDIEGQIEEGILSLSGPITKVLRNVEKKTVKQEKEDEKVLVKKLKKEKKYSKAERKKGLFTKIIDSLADE